MRVIDQTLFAELNAAGEIKSQCCEFLDGIKIGLRINRTVLQLPPKINGNDVGSVMTERIDLATSPLLSNQFYLATSIEKICVSNRIVGFLHTRSRWARLGLDCVGSSNFVSPGFGGGNPTPLVLEIRPATSIYELDLDEALAAIVLFELDKPVMTKNANHHILFPFAQIDNAQDN